MSQGIGQCSQCGQNNSFVATACWACGARLPWADVAERAAQNTGAAPAPVEAPVAVQQASDVVTGNPSGIIAAPPLSLPQVPPSAGEVSDSYVCCGLTLGADMNFCPKCGRALKAPQAWTEAPAWRVPTPGAATTERGNSKDRPSWLLGTLGFLFPIVGIIIYFFIRRRTPRRAMSALVCAGIGILFNVIYVIVAGVDPTNFNYLK